MCWLLVLLVLPLMLPECVLLLLKVGGGWYHNAHMLAVGLQHS